MAGSGYAQQITPAATPSRPRFVQTTPAVTPTPGSKAVVVTETIPTPRPAATPAPVIVGSTAVEPTLPPSANTKNTLSFSLIRSKLEEAKREMAGRPIPTAMTDSILQTSIVRVAFYDWDTHKIDYVVLTKESFLTKNGEFGLTSSGLKPVTVRIIRPNGVNTPITITDQNNKFHLPLMVQYPVERNGTFYETAYYMSTHPGLVTPETVNAGKLYVRNTIDVAREKLRQNGYMVAPKIADIAERLSIVEHVDHLRFRTEYHPNVYNDIFALYALNEGQTYRYSVSTAGAGGMVQMIPSTYAMVRNRFSNAGLMPDFVEGMRNHVNASKAMLLYIQMTYDDLVASPTVLGAILDGTATEAELLAAGYNSNPARLAGYIKRGGSNWRNLIPRETQIYLQINASMDTFVPIAPRSR